MSVCSVKYFSFFGLILGIQIGTASSSTTDSSTVQPTTEEVITGRYLYGRWQQCEPIPGSMDQTCAGTHDRKILFINNKDNSLINRTTETEDCFIPTTAVDGGYTDWTPWADCSNNCNGQTTRRRYCNNPTPCNGGKDCQDLGTDTLVKDCGPQDGQWNSWGRWGSCDLPSSSSQYGTGTHTRQRFCNYTIPICGGEYCKGSDTENGNCRVAPPCLSTELLDVRYLKKDSPMVIYTSANVEVYPLTENNCTHIILYNYWKLLLLNSSSNNETEIQTVDTLKFKFISGIHEVGLYRLYIKIGYPYTFTHWMDESMYIQILHPPPHAMIRGGHGRTIGQGNMHFDARSVSYGLTNGPGNPSGLTFMWKCLNFMTDSLYSLIKLQFDPSAAFNETSVPESYWYDTQFTQFTENIAPWISTSTLYQRVQLLKAGHGSCLNATELDVIVYSSNITNSNLTSSNTEMTESIPFVNFYNIQYMLDMDTGVQPNRTTEDIYPFPSYNTLVQNELISFFDMCLDSDTLLDDLEEFFTLLSLSKLKLESILPLQDVQGLPLITGASFFDDLNDWLQKAATSIEVTNQMLEVLTTLSSDLTEIYNHLDLVKVIGIDGYLLLQLDNSEACLMDYVSTLMEGFLVIDAFDWYDMKTKDNFYSNWIQNELYKVTACTDFDGNIDGNASLIVSNADVQNGMGYLVMVKVSFEGSVSYFTQYAQSDPNITPLLLDIECRLNCMKKTAITAMMSLKSSCPYCTANQLIGAKYWWNMMDIDMVTQVVSNNTKWQSWMIEDTHGRKFLMNANVLDQNSGYMLEAFLQLSTGEIHKSIMLISTNLLPYSGECEINENRDKLTVKGWKDEGFRSIRNPSLDWKEQINYRIVQITGSKETLLYYGAERESHIQLKPGLEEDDYQTTVVVQIYDIFIDFQECIVRPGKIYPPYDKNETKSISKYLASSKKNVEYHLSMGNIKQVGMISEVAGTSTHTITIPKTIFDTDPSDYTGIGVGIDSGGVTRNLTFDELIQQIENPYYGDVSANNEIVSTLYDFVQMLNNSTEDADQTSTVNIDLLVHSIGTNIANKQFVSKNSVSVALEAGGKLLTILTDLARNQTYPKYEDYYAVSEGFLRVLNNILEGLLPPASPDVPPSTDFTSIKHFLDERLLVSSNVSDNLTSIERTHIVQQIAARREMDIQLRNEIVQRKVPELISQISDLSTIMEMLSFRKQLPISVQQGNITTSHETADIGDMVRKGLEQDGINIQFEYTSAGTTEEQNFKVTDYTNNPFSWSDQSQYITSHTINVKVEDSDPSSSPLSLSDIKIRNDAIQTPAQSVSIAVSNDDQSSTQSVVYKMYWNNPIDDILFFIEGDTSNMNITVYVSQTSYPSRSNNVWSGEVNTGQTSTPSILIQGGIFSTPLTVNVGVYFRKEESSKPTNFRGRRSVPSTNTTVIEYQMRAVTTGCRVWDNTTDSWDRISCKVSSLSTINETICVCSNPPGENFATTFYVPPNTIDFSTVFNKFNLKDNAAVFATVVSILILYVIINVWAYRQDKRDPDRWAISYLRDNSPYDQHTYLVTVYTGLYRNSGTKSNVYIKIIEGIMKKKMTTRSRKLDDIDNKGFDTGSIRRFVMTTPHRITDPAALKVWHDNTGPGNSASWYLHKITVEEIKTSRKFIFICDSWLSLDRDNDSIECTIPVTNPYDIDSFVNSFNDKSREKITDSYLWVSIVVRPKEDYFSRVQRLACCLTLLFLTMISSAMFYQQDTGKQFAVGPLSFSLTGIYISFVSALISAPPILLLVYIFRHSKPKKDDQSSNIKADKLKLPYWTKYLAWLLIVVAVLLSGFFLILYSMEWGKSRSEQWLLSFFLSFLESTMIVDPLKVIIIAVVLSLICKRRNASESEYDYKAIINEARRRALTSEITATNFKDEYKENNSPVDQKSVLEMREKRKLALKTKRVILEIILYLIFMAIVYLISFSNRDPRWFYLKQHLDNSLVVIPNISKSDDVTLRFNQITSGSQLYAFMTETLLPFLFARSSFAGGAIDPIQRLYVSDLVNYRIGPVRLRQLRMRKESCKTSKYNMTLDCFDKYSMADDDDQSYCVGWANPPCPTGESIYKKSSAAWKFLTASDVWGLPIWGMVSTYAGGGYLTDMSINYQISNQVVNELKDYLWIDRKTRAVFIEFSMYNFDDNVFLYANFLTEFPETGGTVTSFSFKPFRPYQHIGDLGVFVFMCEALSFIGIAILTVKKIMYFRRHGKKAFRNIWYVFDVAIVILYFASIVTYIGRWVMINYAMDKFNSDQIQFVNFHHIVIWDDLFNICLAIVIFCITFRFMRIFNFSQRISHMGYIFMYISRDIGGCLFMFLIVYMAFVIFGHLIFGRQLETYKNLFVSSTTLTNAVVGKNSINDLFSISPVLGRMYYFSFVFFLLWVMMTMLNAALNVGITSASVSYEKKSESFSLRQQLVDMIKSVTANFIRRPEPKKGADLAFRRRTCWTIENEKLLK